MDNDVEGKEKESDYEDSMKASLLLPVRGIHDRCSGILSYGKWLDLYGYMVDEIVFYTLERLPMRTAAGDVVKWSDVKVRDIIAWLCYVTSINRYRRFTPVL